MAEIDEPGDDEAVVIACIQEFEEFINRKLRRYPLDAIAVAAGTHLEGLCAISSDWTHLVSRDRPHLIS